MRLIPTLGIGADSREPSRREPALDTSHAASAGTRPLRIGEMLMQSGALDQSGVQRVLAQQEKDGHRFGESALRLRLIKPKDLERALSTQFAHPLFVDDDALSRELVAAFKPASRQVEQLRQQRSLLAQRWFANHGALAIVSPERDEGRSFYAANMALLFAQLGRPTLLIDADMRRPRQHTLFGVPNRLGLSSVLAGRIRPEEAVANVGAIASLSVLPAGPVPPNPLELLDRGGLSGALKELSHHFAVIILDTPAGNHRGDANVAAHACQGALMLVRRHRTRLREAQALAAGLSRAEVKVVGTVMNRY